MDIVFDIVNNGVVTEYWADVTDTVKNLMGDVVTSAKMCMLMVDANTPKEDADDIALLLKGTVRKIIETANENGQLEFDKHVLEICFVSGKTVRFHSSEWCTMYNAR